MAARILRGEKLEQEMTRLEAMAECKKEYDTCTYICGTDEAGRGPLAGSVAAGAVVLPEGHHILYPNDSKELSGKCREGLFLEIKEKAVAWGAGLTSPARIDEVNILQTIYEAMREVVKGLSVKPGVLLDNAVTIPRLKRAQVPIIKGGAKSLSIAAASTLAKVTRNRTVAEYEELFPGYGFARHKGYGTAAHITAIRGPGSCPVHKRNFIRNIVQANTYE